MSHLSDRFRPVLGLQEGCGSKGSLGPVGTPPECCWAAGRGYAFAPRGHRHPVSMETSLRPTVCLCTAPTCHRSRGCQAPHPQAPHAPPGNEAAVFSPASLEGVPSPRPGQPPQTRRTDMAETASVCPACSGPAQLLPSSLPSPSSLHRKEPRPEGDVRVRVSVRAMVW